MQRKFVNRTLAAIVAGVGAVLFVWGFVLEPASLRERDFELGIPRWPSGCDGIRVAVLADLHTGSPWNGIENLERIVALTGQSAPDLVLLAGDFVIHGVVGGDFVAPEAAGRILGKLSAPLGVWAVLGNHDWWLDGPRVRAALEASGIRFLENAAARIESNSCVFWLAGIGDYWEGSPDVSGTFAQVTDDAPILAFTHNPDVFPEIPDRVSLTIAGHTHGGQVYIPFLGRPIVPSKYGERFAIGHVVEGARHLFVSPGIGTSILPVRFLVPPEVPVLELKSIRSGTLSGGPGFAAVSTNFPCSFQTPRQGLWQVATMQTGRGPCQNAT